MENTSYALHIAAGLMIAIMVIGLILYVYRAMSTEQKSEDDVWATKTKAEFNEAFLAYDKPLMYGTDVLSCLNKAQSNNQRYVYNNYYGTDQSSVEAREEHLINVEVILHSDVQETITVYYRDGQGKLVAYTNGEFSETIPNLFSSDNKTKYFKLEPIKYYYFDSKQEVVKANTSNYKAIMWGSNSNITSLKTQTVKTNLKGSTEGNKYYLYNENSNNKLNQLSALLSTVTTVEQTIEHFDNINDYNDELKSNDYKSIWYSATWRSAVYDFKTKKFQCNSVSYNSDTGYINYIVFEEKK